ncbi:MAG: substrate-binding domain-containing protein [Hydrogenophaga sp.]|nr:substrate-binding domain-containing protein [Hydrogenophaga sp.]
MTQPPPSVAIGPPLQRSPSTERVVRPTARDVAQLAGMALGTVSRVVNDVPTVRQDARDKVLAAMAELGWKPNAAAQHMRGRASRIVGFIFSDIRNPLYASMIKGAEDVLSRQGYTLMVSSSDGLPEREIALLDLFGQRQADGLIFAISQESHAGVQATLSQAGYPFILLEREMALRAGSVGADHDGGTRHATRYLLELGHRRIALVSGGQDNRVGRDRLQGFVDAHHAAGVALDPSLIRHESFAEEYGFRQTQLLLDHAIPPTALLVLGQHLLRGVLRAIRLKGIAIPQQLSLIVSNDSELAQLATPAISAIRYDAYALGREAAQLLLQRLREGPDWTPTRIEVPTEFVLRDSCAAPPRATPSPSATAASSRTPRP